MPSSFSTHRYFFWTSQSQLPGLRPASWSGTTVRQQRLLLHRTPSNEPPAVTVLARLDGRAADTATYKEIGSGGNAPGPDSFLPQRSVANQLNGRLLAAGIPKH